MEQDKLALIKHLFSWLLVGFHVFFFIMLVMCGSGPSSWFYLSVFVNILYHMILHE